MTSISVDQLSLSRGKAGEWHDHRGGSRVVRDIQAGITHEIHRSVAKSTLVGNTHADMPQTSTLGAFSGIAIFLGGIALDFCRTWNEKRHL